MVQSIMPLSGGEADFASLALNSAEARRFRPSNIGPIGRRCRKKHAQNFEEKSAIVLDATLGQEYLLNLSKLESRERS